MKPLRTLSTAAMAAATAQAQLANMATDAPIADADTKWYAPAQSQINNPTSASSATGVYGFIYNSSETANEDYGVYNWCNMPHIRRSEYVRPAEEYELQYVELMHRHHKRTPYASNAFPVESYEWNCEDARLFLYGRALPGHDPALVYRHGYTSPVNPFVPSGWIGSCSFPQITAGGLRDSRQHGADLYGVYHDLLGFLPDKSDAYEPKVRYRVTNNPITSQVAGMIVSGMWDSSGPFPLLIQAEGIDSLEPQYSCRAANRLFNSIKSQENPDWQHHLEQSASLYQTLDDISGVSPHDGGFHASFDHYYDNLSARQCHDKPLPCKLVDGINSTTCVTQSLADSVYRMGNWEYSHVYRDHPSSLAASAASLGVWIGELARHIRDFMSGQTDVIYYHNVAHDGSVSRLLSILQVDTMVWPGMGAEIVFELYKRKEKQHEAPTTTTAIIGSTCHHDNCLRHMIRHPASANSACKLFGVSTSTEPVARPTWPFECHGHAQLSSACACLAKPTPSQSITAAATSTDVLSSKHEYYLRVLFGGQVLESSHPALGRMAMVPAEILLSYFDGLVGEDSEKVKSKCE